MGLFSRLFGRRTVMDELQSTIEPVSRQSPLGRGRMSRQDPPESPVIYRILEKETRSIRKIGVTNNGRRRKKEHTKSGLHTDYTVFAWKPFDTSSTQEDGYAAERRHIKKHKPAGNRHPGGNGPRGSRW